MREQVSEILSVDVIKPIEGSWSWPVVLANKKDGNIGFCVDYRGLNEVTKKEVYPFPRMDDVLQFVRGNAYF